MNSTSLTFVFLLLVFFVENEGASDNLQTPPQHNKLRIPEIFQQNDALPPQIDNCDTYVIFDLSKNVVTKEIFDVSIKIFLKYILQYCNGFKFVVIDDNFNGCGSSQGCNVTFTKCDGSNACIDNMEFSSRTSSYSGNFNDSSPDILERFNQFLNEMFAEMPPSKDSSVILLTNRVLSVDADSEFVNTVDTTSLRVITILLGINETNASNILQSAYENVPNITTLSFPNYDCLSYLFYCLIPCSNVKPECMKVDINDCQIPTTTPNKYPEKTLHIWYVFDFNENTMDFNTVRNNIVLGLSEYIENSDIRKVRIRYVFGTTTVTLSSEDANSIYSLPYVYIENKGDVIDDSDDDDIGQSYSNYLMSFLPWSGTLTDTRIGIKSVIILTNYASTLLKTVTKDQTLEGSMYVFNQRSFEYYSENLPKNVNFELVSADFSDTIVVKPITTSNPAQETSSTVIASTSGEKSDSPSTTSAEISSTENHTLSVTSTSSTTSMTTSTKSSAPLVSKQHYIAVLIVIFFQRVFIKLSLL